MLELIQSGGLLMIALLLCSVLAAAISVERWWTLQAARVAPNDLLANTWGAVKEKKLDQARLRSLRTESPLGQVLAAGLVNASRGREIMKEAMEEAAGQVMHELQRYLTALGTIAAISPLIGLLGTVVGMIKVFTVLQVNGAGNANLLAGGISQALITTAAGISVAIPALIFHRMFVRKVDEHAVTLEQQGSKLIDIMMGDRATTDRSVADGVQLGEAKA